MSIHDPKKPFLPFGSLSFSLSTSSEISCQEIGSRCSLSTKILVKKFDHDASPLSSCSTSNVPHLMLVISNVCALASQRLVNSPFNSGHDQYDSCDTVVMNQITVLQIFHCFWVAISYQKQCFQCLSRNVQCLRDYNVSLREELVNIVVQRNEYAYIDIDI